VIQYLDKKNRLLFVSKSIGQVPLFGTFWRKGESQAKHRVKTKFLPMRRNRKKAENDLVWYALKHNLVPVTVTHEE